MTLFKYFDCKKISLYLPSLNIDQYCCVAQLMLSKVLSSDMENACLLFRGIMTLHV